MTLATSLVNVKSPFKAVAEYPPAFPYVGQDSAYHRLLDFTQSMRAEEQAHFLALFGPWAIGKSRLAHELVAQFCGQSHGWTLTDGQAAESLLAPLTQGGDVLPLFVPFVDVINFQEFGLDSGTAMGKITCAAASWFAGKRVRDANYQLLEALRAGLTAVNPNIDFDRIAEIANDSSRGYAERASLIVSALGAMTGGRVRRILVIVDEVESGGDINPFAEELEKEVRSRPIPQRAVRDLYSGVKDASNTNAYPSLNFLFFNTEAAKRLAHMEALERRMPTADLDKATATDLDRLLGALRTWGYPLDDMLEDLARRAFFAADRNFGWFSFIMNKAHRVLADQPNLSIGQVFEEVCKRTGKVFQPGVFEDRDISPQALKDAMRRVIYNQLPSTLTDLGIDVGLRPPMLAYQDPFQTRFIGETVVVAVSADMLTRELLDSGLYTSDVQPTLTGEGSVRFDPAKVLDSLRTFAWTSQAGDMGASAYLWIYVDPADFENQVNFAYSGFGADLSATTARAIHKLLLERHRVGQETFTVAPTMTLLRRFNDLWGKAAANDWLPESDWERIISAIDNNPQLNDQRLLQGIANALFDSPEPQTSPSPYPNVKAPSLTLKLQQHDIFNVTARNQLALLKARETPQGTLEDLRAIGVRVPVLLIFSQTYQLDVWERYLRESHEEHVAVAVITHVVEPQTREWEFYIRYALRNAPDGFKSDAVNNRGKDLRGEFREVLNERFKQWLAASELRGYVLRPFYPAKSASAPAFRDFSRAWAALLQAGSVAALDAEGATVLKHLEDYEREQKDDTLCLTEGSGPTLRAMVPAVVPHLLDVLRGQPRKLPDLVDDVFFVRSQRAVSFPANGNGVVEQLLTLLQAIGVVEFDAVQNRYSARSIASFNTKFDQAFQRLGSQQGTLSGYAQEVADLSDAVQSLATQLHVNGNQLILLKSQKLMPEQARLEKLPLNRLIDLPADQQAFAEVTRSIGAISAALDEVLGATGAIVTPPAIDPYTLQENINRLAADSEYREYPIEYRINFLKQLQKYLRDADRQLRAAVTSKRATLESATATESSVFPPRPFVALLDGVQADMDDVLPTLPPQLRQQPQDALLTVLKGAGQLRDVLLKLNWYAAQLDEQNSTGWWVRYTSAREQWKVASDEFAQTNDAWARLEKYFAGTPPEHSVTFTGPELDDDVHDLSETMADFGTNYNVPQVSIDDLEAEIQAIRERCSSIAERIRAARESAGDEIQKKLDESNDVAVRHLAERLNKLSVIPDRQRVANAHTHQDAHSALDRYLQQVREIGAGLCERSELYDRFLQIYHDRSQGMTGEQVYARYDEKILREMSDRKLITLRYTVDV